MSLSRTCLLTVVLIGFPASTAQAQPTLKLALDPATKNFVDDGFVRVRLTETNNEFPLKVVATNHTLPTSPTPASTVLRIVVAHTKPVAVNFGDLTAVSGTPMEVNVPSQLKDTLLTLRTVATYTYATPAPPAAPTSVSSNAVLVYIDTVGPAPTTPEVDRFPGGGGTITIPFADTDLDPKTLSLSKFTLKQKIRVNVSGTETDTTLDTNPDSFKYSAAARTVTLSFANLIPGEYTLEIANTVTDFLGNAATSPANSFTIPGGRQHGKQVEFPRFLRPKGDSSGFNPADRVDTRVISLYYFRDARRVAEIINRNVRDLDRVGYDAAQRFARQAREKAEEQIDERRRLETLAVQDAQRTRESRRELEKAQTDLQAAQSTHEQMLVKENDFDGTLRTMGLQDVSTADIDTEIGSLTTNITNAQAAIAGLPTNNNFPTQTDKDAEHRRLNGVIANHETERRTLQSIKLQKEVLAQRKERIEGEITQLQSKVNQLPGQLSEQQSKEIESRNRVQSAESSELRLEQERFRREVAAGLYDRDTYVAGKITSIDPITQVSITVLGTARLQLRGPIQGINKIRRMIHQIDTPVGQVKIGIHTIQINGEHGDRMDVVYERINKEIAHSRFLVNASGRLMRQAVAQVATAVTSAVDKGHVPDGCPMEFAQIDSPEACNWRYVYCFFGSDFINELRRMNSELIQPDNKLLSLHSMDTISLAGALYVTALAKNDIRMMILDRFQTLVREQLPQREIEYLKNLNQVHVNLFGKLCTPSQWKQNRMDAKLEQQVYYNANRLYTFPNTITFFNNQIADSGALNSVQYATVRMAQVLKAQLVAELEYKNIVLERSLLEVEKGETEKKLLKTLAVKERSQKILERSLLDVRESANKPLRKFSEQLQILSSNPPENFPFDNVDRQYAQLLSTNLLRLAGTGEFAEDILSAVIQNKGKSQDDFSFSKAVATDVYSRLLELEPKVTVPQATQNKFRGLLNLIFWEKETWVAMAQVWTNKREEAEIRKAEADEARTANEEQEKLFFSKRLLDQFMDEQEEKSVELLEALRAMASNVDNYLKRLAIALEDDVNAQFYEPAFQHIRKASHSWDVNLGQIETTTVLTNNRTLAKVSPSATMEFNLPRRDILLTEAFKGSKALMTEYGNLMQDGAFLAGTSLLAGAPATGLVGSAAPLQGIPGVPSGDSNEFGSELQKLIPEPEIYKFETGTGFEIRPVIQPDGHSIIYTFDYMYTTNVREPVRADEKHLGRVKRHFVHTDVQTSSYELREISRYTVALKASRTDRGVPLFEDIPILGAAFRPLPSAESSLQQNIILASSVIYPTMFDLMGLRWSPYANDVNSGKLVEEKQQQLSRRDELRKHLRATIQGRVNKAIGIPNPKQTSVLEVPPGPLAP